MQRVATAYVDGGHSTLEVLDGGFDVIVLDQQCSGRIQARKAAYASLTIERRVNIRGHYAR